MSSKAEELAASLESGEMGDEKYLGGTGGKGRSKTEIGQKQSANADPSKKAVGAVISGENARKTS